MLGLVHEGADAFKRPCDAGPPQVVFSILLAAAARGFHARMESETWRGPAAKALLEELA